jgi:hypothetical protein
MFRRIISCIQWFVRVDLVSIRLLEEQLRFDFAGHCMRSKPSISELLLWDHTKVAWWCKCAKEAYNPNYSRQLLKAIGKVEGYRLVMRKCAS